MDRSDFDLDWGVVPSLLAVADGGSLTVAARRLGLSQPTLGRQIQAAEKALGETLFERHPRGLTPTKFLQQILPLAREMEAAARTMSLRAMGEAREMAGKVRLTASEVVSAYLLPPILAEFRRTYPEIAVELVPTDTTQNLLFHEADIALRMYRPTQLDMITRHMGDLPLGLYAAESYLARRGEPRRLGDLRAHDLIGYDRDDRLIHGLGDVGLEIRREDFAIRCDNQVAYWELVRAGAGIGIGQQAVAVHAPHLRQILPDGPYPSLPVYLTAHERLRHVPRVDAMWQALRTGLAPALVKPT